MVDAILKLREETGDFGELVYAGMDWVDPALARRSMQLMAEEVMPRVNAAIGKGKPRRSNELGGAGRESDQTYNRQIGSGAPTADPSRRGRARAWRLA